MSDSLKKETVMTRSVTKMKGFDLFAKDDRNS